jgi:nitrate/TMAO reductase-like tetraheme cytochrome c subunit
VKRSGAKHYFLLLAVALALTLSAAWPTQAEDLFKQSCIICHRQLERETSQPVRLWSKSVHARANVSCVDCHGGDPTSTILKEAHGKDFHGVPSPQEVPDFCGNCHSKASRMRQYNLRTDQLDLYHISEHGQKLKAGDKKVATCISCHSSHDVYDVNDPVSPVYKANVPATCARCHSDAEHMKGYKIPINQFEEYKAGYHGSLLLEQNNFKVPTCADCHGIHGASPPTVEEVVSVCGNCHVVTTGYFKRSSHWRALVEGGLPNCVTCHGKHRINFPEEELFSGGKAGRCGSCHKEDSAPYAVGQTFRKRIEQVRRAISKTEGKLLELQRLGGFEISQWREELREATAKLTEALPVTHSLSVHLMEQRIVEAEDKLNEVGRLVDQQTERIEFRRTGLAVTLSLIGLMVGLLVLKKHSLHG